MTKYHNVTNVHFEGNMFIVTIDGKERRYSIDNLSHKLLNASATDRNNYEISPSGYGIHWPSLDEDISIDGLLGIVHQREPEKHAA